MIRILLSILALAVAFVACEKKPAPRPAPQQAPQPAPTPAPQPTQPQPQSPTSGGGKVEVLGLSFAVPENWRSVPPTSPMRLAELKVPDPSGEASKACDVVFSSAGGTVEANIERWRGQVRPASDAPASEPSAREVAGMKVTTVEFVGTYAGMGETPPRENYMLRGAIIETPAGLLFIKMTGPAEQMVAARAGFDALLDSMAKP